MRSPLTGNKPSSPDRLAATTSNNVRPRQQQAPGTKPLTWAEGSTDNNHNVSTKSFSRKQPPIYIEEEKKEEDKDFRMFVEKDAMLQALSSDDISLDFETLANVSKFIDRVQEKEPERRHDLNKTTTTTTNNLTRIATRGDRSTLALKLSSDDDASIDPQTRATVSNFIDRLHNANKDTTDKVLLAAETFDSSIPMALSKVMSSESKHSLDSTTLEKVSQFIDYVEENNRLRTEDIAAKPPSILKRIDAYVAEVAAHERKQALLNEIILAVEDDDTVTDKDLSSDTRTLIGAYIQSVFSCQTNTLDESIIEETVLATENTRKMVGAREFIDELQTRTMVHPTLSDDGFSVEDISVTEEIIKEADLFIDKLQAKVEQGNKWKRFCSSYEHAEFASSEPESLPIPTSSKEVNPPTSLRRDQELRESRSFVNTAEHRRESKCQSFREEDENNLDYFPDRISWNLDPEIVKSQKFVDNTGELKRGTNHSPDQEAEVQDIRKKENSENTPIHLKHESAHMTDGPKECRHMLYAKPKHRNGTPSGRDPGAFKLAVSDTSVETERKPKQTTKCIKTADFSEFSSLVTPTNHQDGPWWEAAARLGSNSSDEHENPEDNEPEDLEHVWTTSYSAKSITVASSSSSSDTASQRERTPELETSPSSNRGKHVRERRQRLNKYRYKFSSPNQLHSSSTSVPTTSRSFDTWQSEEAWIRKRNMASWTPPNQNWLSSGKPVQKASVKGPGPIDGVAVTRGLHYWRTRGNPPLPRNWTRPYDIRTEEHPGYCGVHVHSLYASSMVNRDPHHLDKIPWEHREVKQRFLYEQSITKNLNWFGALVEKPGNEKIYQPVCRPKSMDMETESDEWNEEWYVAPTVFPLFSNLSGASSYSPRSKSSQAAMGVRNLDVPPPGPYRNPEDDVNEEYSDNSWDDETPECGSLRNVKLRIGERITRVTPDITSSLRRSRWRKKYFPRGTFPY